MDHLQFISLRKYFSQIVRRNEPQKLKMFFQVSLKTASKYMVRSIYTNINHLIIVGQNQFDYTHARSTQA